MFIPIHDGNPLTFVRFQYVTVALIIVNTLVFAIFQSPLFGAAPEPAALSYGLIPVVLNGAGALSPEFARIPSEVTLVTYSFLHGSWMHLIGNMAFLWVFGDNVEDAVGHLRYLVFYILCGIAAGAAQAFMLPGSDQPLVGASGAVSGIIAAYLMLHPRVRVWVLFLGRIPLRISAAWALGLWAGLQVFNAFTSADDQIAWWAHIGGLAAGALLIVFMRRRDVPLFDKGLTSSV